MYYRKYRPQKFSELSKPNELAESLMIQAKNHKTVHAYLFSGPRGTGKTTNARILAKALNCEKLQDNGDPCDKCENCKSITNGRFPDLLEIDAASNRGIDDIRDLRDKVKLAPTIGKVKFYIIDEVHMLTNEAFNALLKTLEEPPKNVVFVLCTTEFHKVPDTIKSRCQVFKLKKATISQITERLKKIAKSEKANVDEETLEKIASASYGGFRDADTLLQQIVEGNVDVNSLIGTTSKQSYLEFINCLINSDSADCIKIINRSAEEGVDSQLWVTELLNYLRNLLYIKAGVQEAREELTDDILEKIKIQEQKLDVSSISRMVNLFMTAYKQIKDTPIAQLPLELAVLSYLESEDKFPSIKNSSMPTGPGIGQKKSPLTQATKQSSKASPSDQDDDLKPVIPLEEINNKWEIAIKESIKHNHSISALLKAVKPIEVLGNTVILEVAYSFHKERLEDHKNRQIVEQILKDIYKIPLAIKCRVNEINRPKKNKETGVLTDYNVSVPSQIFDGALPMV